MGSLVDHGKTELVMMILTDPRKGIWIVPGVSNENPPLVVKYHQKMTLHLQNHIKCNCTGTTHKVEYECEKLKSNAHNQRNEGQNILAVSVTPYKFPEISRICVSDMATCHQRESIENFSNLPSWRFSFISYFTPLGDFISNHPIG